MIRRSTPRCDKGGIPEWTSHSQMTKFTPHLGHQSKQAVFFSRFGFCKCKCICIVMTKNIRLTISKHVLKFQDDQFYVVWKQMIAVVVELIIVMIFLFFLALCYTLNGTL